MRTCALCDRKLPSRAGNRRKYCDLCRRADPHRHAARSRKLPSMFVTVDGEGEQLGDVMHLKSFSYGREDGTSSTIFTDSPQEVCHWLLNELQGVYKDLSGKEWRQVPNIFHGNWDSAVLGKSFKAENMMLVHKAQAREVGLLCNTRRCRGACGKLHRLNEKHINAVITDGGDGDVIAWEPESKIAIAFTPGRRIYIEYRPNGDRYEGWKRLDIHDVGNSFLGKLEDVFNTWNPDLSPEQREIISRGKRDRETGFAGWTEGDLGFYSESECVATSRICRKLMDNVRAAGIPMNERKLFGSGSIATAAMKFHHVPKRDETDLGDEDTARLTYYGGLIEAPVVGRVPSMDVVDINSAYPSVQVDLPCMKKGHGHWHKHEGDIGPKPGVVGHVLATWSIPEGTSTPPFTVRNVKGRVFQPRSGVDTWVTLAEYTAARKKFKSAVFATKAEWWVPECACELPFAWVKEMYDRRLAIKDEMDEMDEYSAEWDELNMQQWTIKRIINSIYGKLAQTRPYYGIYTNLHYASHITGTARAMVREETWKREEQLGIVLYQHTDAVGSIGGNPRDGGRGLGKWSLERQSRDVLIVQPGLAVALGGGKTASRGCRKSDFVEAAREWKDTVDFSQPPVEWPELLIPGRRMLSRRAAIARGRPELAGSFVDLPLNVRVASHKRDFDRAVRIPGTDAWRVPPIEFVYDVATLESLKAYRSAVDIAIANGDYDRYDTLRR